MDQKYWWLLGGGVGILAVVHYRQQLQSAECFETRCTTKTGKQKDACIYECLTGKPFPEA